MSSAIPPTISLDQPSLPGLCSITDAAFALSQSSAVDERGAIFTRRTVVDFILDLVGYTVDADLFNKTLLEPSFGGGDFLLPAVERLLAARRRAVSAGGPAHSIKHCITAVELHRSSYETTRLALIAMLESAEFDTDEARDIASSWLVHGDFLLAALPEKFDYVVGNPPYVRQELIAAPLLAEYRRRYATLYDRADLYIPFIERSLRLLGDGGQLSFICADRWMKNKYGGPLRALVSSSFHLRAYVDMVDADAFHSDVIAYAAITVISKGAPGPTRVALRPALDAPNLAILSQAFRATEPASALVKDLADVVCGSSPWILESSDQTALIQRLEQSFPTLEEAGCKVGIGVATGADKAFIGKFDELDVEPDRKLPIAMTRDLTSGHVEWRGYGVINPFTDEGPLVDLERYPKLKKYLEERRDQIAGRHVAQKSPANWYRTIDRITPSLASRPKLLIPDIKGDAQVAYENGKLYPHHNLYFVVSDAWDLHALQAVLLSNITRLVIATYSTKMRGGFLRFQAQYLRRIRLPRWEGVPAELRERLANAAITLDISACNEASAELYFLTLQERNALANNT
ncbi:Eco57I restriction-modification methylase domain-containing protein [Massilia psychrophila]|uniref:site-specific DNA-methyltransferase (adenine-specific) n=1 Tax=Massilia psychrophila TaxID=1603353 RepID=A0A2G8SZL5_9BURK|nr:Eco57I restriction-modification methylase domain-containing protein [Massilia psychrophila]PIL39211.1 SAM-dependent methyltransferase [Massilia psychrophila]GGE81999.1 type II DNA modification methyltransferase [Massilia psychrophila]